MLSTLSEKFLEVEMGKVITVDGPAASGKTSVSRELAKRLGWSWVSTGAFYRGLAYVAQQLNYDLSDEAKLAALASDPVWRVDMQDDNTKVIFGGKDVTALIHTEEVGAIASRTSSLPMVRQALLAPQRMCAANTPGLVAEGRDCGTVVFPQAEVKIYLTARQEDRAERRAKDLGTSVDDTAKAQAQRDQQDSSRKTAPLQVPEQALVVDTSAMNLNQVVEEVENFARKNLKI